MTVDLITEIAFGKSFDLLIKAENNTFNTSFLECFDMASESVWDLMYFPILRVMVNNAPPTIAAKLSQSEARYQSLLGAVANTVAEFRQSSSFGKSLELEVVFSCMSHLDDTVLLAEATDILVAGSDTTATTLAIAIQEIIKRPAILKKLKDELRELGFVIEEDYKLVELEKL